MITILVSLTFIFVLASLILIGRLIKKVTKVEDEQLVLYSHLLQIQTKLDFIVQVCDGYEDDPLVTNISSEPDDGNYH